MTDIVDIGYKVDSRQIKKANDRLDDMARSSKKANKASSSLLSGLMKFASLSAIVGVMWKVVDVHREFTKSISELSAITGATGEDLKFYREQAKLLGSTTTFAASEVATAFKLVASAKPELLDSKEALASVTREVLTLAEASGMELAGAADALGGALNQFGAGAEEASRFINVLAAGSKYGSSAINDTAQAMKNAGAVAAGLGLTFEQTNTAIQLLAANNIKGAEAGTALRGTLLKLATQSRDEFNPEVVGLSKALQNLQDANLSTTEKTKIFGQESITAANILIQQAGAVDELTQKLTGTGIAYEQARINTDNLDGDLKQLGSQWESVAIMMGEVFDPALRGVVQAMSWAAKVGKSVVLAIEDMGQMIGAFGAQVAAVLELDFELATEIGKIRDKEAKDNEKRLEAIWEEKDLKEIAAKKEEEQNEKRIEANKKVIEQEKEKLKIAREKQAASAHEAAMDEMLRQAELEQELMEKESDRRDAEEDQRMEALLNQAIADEMELDRIAEQNEQKLALERDYWDRLFDMQAGSQTAMLEFGKAMRDSDYKSALQYGAAALSNAAKQNKQMFQVQKALALANVAVNLPDAIIQSFKNGGGYPWGLIPAAAMAYQGYQQIKAIQSASFGGGARAPSVGGGGGTSPSAPVASGLPAGTTALPSGDEQRRTQVTISLEGNRYTKEEVRELIGQINEEVGEGTELRTA